MKTNLLGGMVAGLFIAALAGMFATRSVSAEGDAAKGAFSGPRYSVVETEGHNLIVTDNQKEILYFYTIEKDAKIGSELKLRGTVDLKQVGKKVVKPGNVKLREDK
jgi:hypothetical protein